MQRTFRSRFASYSQQSQSISNHRNPSTISKSPVQLLQLIKQRRSRIKSNNEEFHSEAKKREGLELVLPKINSICTHIKLNKREEDNQKQQFKQSQNQNQNQGQSQKPNLISKNSLQLQVSRNSNRNNQTVSKQKYFKRYKTIEIDSTKQCLLIENQDQDKTIDKGIQKIRKIMTKQHVTNKDKNIQYIVPIVDYLVTNNIMFNNLPKMLIFTIVNKSKIRFYQSATWIYKKNEVMNSFYIILCGKVKTFNFDRNYKKISITGETISEEILFIEWNPKNLRNQGAKSITDVFLLEIHYDVYLKLNKDLILQGYKSEFLTLETMIKRNYVQKKKMKEI